jgi:general L-amino acid transport system permease protein
MSATQPTSRSPQSILSAFFRNVRVLQIFGQIIFAIVLVFLVSQLLTAILTSLRSKNLTPNTAFLQDRAGFDIGEKPDWYTADNKYGEAFQVGVVNTLRIVGVGLVLTTIVGIIGGVALLSSNWLVRTIFRAVVDVLRNTPLIVQLFIWYFVIIQSFPPFQQPITFPPESIAQIPLRLFIYIAAWYISRRSVARLDMNAPRRVLIMTGLAAAIVAVEFAFWLSATQAGWRGIYSSGDFGSGGLWLYIILSVLLLGAAWWLAPAVWRWRALGLAVGQLVGGLLFYFGIIPVSAFRIELSPFLYMSIRGIAFPEARITSRFGEWIAFVSIGVALAAAMWVYFGRITETTGRPIPRGLYGLIAIVGFTVAGWYIVGIEPSPATIPVQKDDQTVVMPLAEARAAKLLTTADEQLYSTQPLLILTPQRNNFKFLQGTEISPEYMALLLGLVVYTSSFVAEIVRAGILAVPRGQLEAARALGLSTGQMLRMIILPQALRVIIPPLGNQYLNLSKNSSLAIAIAYADVVAVTQTIMNQSGQSVTGITMIMFTFLAISLAISAVVNRLNSRFQLVTR